MQRVAANKKRLHVELFDPPANPPKRSCKIAARLADLAYKLMLGGPQVWSSRALTLAILNLPSGAVDRFVGASKHIKRKRFDIYISVCTYVCVWSLRPQIS